MKAEPYMWVIGVIDAYGAVHAKGIKLGASVQMHSSYWPEVHHKRWRFLVRDWDLQPGLGTKAADFTEEEIASIMRAVEKLAEKPYWVRKGEAWEAAGRPRGKAQDKFLKEWEKKNPPPERK